MRLSTRALRSRIIAGFIACSCALGCTAELGSLSPTDELDAGSVSRMDGGAQVDGGMERPPAMLDAGADAQVQSDGALDAGPRSCGSVPSGGTESVVGYRSERAIPPSACVQGSQTRTCTDGVWSDFTGDYPATTCMVEGYRNCGSTPHGLTETRSWFTLSSATSAAACATASIAETRTCDDGAFGAWSGGLPAGVVPTCSVELGGACTLFGPLAFPCTVGGCSLTRLTCVAPAGTACTANGTCEGTCVDGYCTAVAAPGGPCDDSADCGGCSSSGQCVAGVCKCNSGSSCSQNAACVQTCRGGFCTPYGNACDANDQADCAQGSVCALSSSFWLCYSDVGNTCNNDNQCQGSCQDTTGLCAVMSLLGGPCDNDNDCDDSASICTNGVCTRDRGESCTRAGDCHSGACMMSKCR